jgi:hypothetical protein
MACHASFLSSLSFGIVDVAWNGNFHLPPHLFADSTKPTDLYHPCMPLLSACFFLSSAFHSIGGWRLLCLLSSFFKIKLGFQTLRSKWKLVVTTVACCWVFRSGQNSGYCCTLLTVCTHARATFWILIIFPFSYIHSDLVHYSIIRAYIVAFKLKDLQIDASSSCIHALIFSNGSDRSD